MDVRLRILTNSATQGRGGSYVAVSVGQSGYCERGGAKSMAAYDDDGRPWRFLRVFSMAAIVWWMAAYGPRMAAHGDFGGFLGRGMAAYGDFCWFLAGAPRYSSGTAKIKTACPSLASLEDCRGILSFVMSIFGASLEASLAIFGSSLEIAGSAKQIATRLRRDVGRGCWSSGFSLIGGRVDLLLHPRLCTISPSAQAKA